MAARVTRYRLLVLAVLCSLSFLTYLDRICIMRVQDDISRDLRFDQSSNTKTPSSGKEAHDRAINRMGWIFAAFAAGYLLFEVPGGWLGDRFGARRVIFRIVLCWSLFTAATGGVQNLTSLFSKNPGPEQWFIALLIIRFLFGAFEAGAYPNVARALAQWFPYRERATAQSFIWFSSRFGGAFAPSIIGGLMLLGGTWQRAFYILGFVGLIWAFLFFAWFRDTPEEKPSVSSTERNWILSGNVRSENIARRKMPWLSLFSPNVLALCVVSFSVNICFYFFITFLPRYLNDQFHLNYYQSQWISGLPLLVGAGACVLGGYLSDYIIQRTGSRRWGRSLVPAFAWSAAALCVFAVPAVNSATAVMVLLTLAFMFQDLSVASMWSVPADIGGPFTATIGAWMNTAGCVAAMLSPLIAAKMSIAYGWNSLFAIFGAVYLLGALAWLRVDAADAIFSPVSKVR
jgi:ACS family glucarate transporter-like MFS transporter